MTPGKSIEVATKLLEELNKKFPHIESRRQSIDGRKWTREQSIAHYKYLAMGIINNAKSEYGSRDKAQRWLGYLQCGMGPSTNLKIHSIRELGEMNMKKPRS
jgi:hypothetical protein